MKEPEIACGFSHHKKLISMWSNAYVKIADLAIPQCVCMGIYIGIYVLNIYFLFS